MCALAVDSILYVDDREEACLPWNCQIQVDFTTLPFALLPEICFLLSGDPTRSGRKWRHYRPGSG